MNPLTRIKLYRLLFVFTGAAFTATHAAHAVSLQDLFDGDTITVAGVTFADWLLDDIVSDASPGSEPDFTLIDVSPFQTGNTVGLRYTANSQWSVTDDNFIDTFYSYTVTAPTAPVVEAQLELTGSGITGFGGSINIIDDLSDAVTLPVGLNAVFVDNLVGDAMLGDSSLLASLSQLTVETSVLIAGDFSGDSVALQTFEQRFVLDQTAVPEPATATLFSAATWAALFASRRRKRR